MASGRRALPTAAILPAVTIAYIVGWRGITELRRPARYESTEMIVGTGVLAIMLAVLLVLLKRLQKRRSD